MSDRLHINVLRGSVSQLTKDIDAPGIEFSGSCEQKEMCAATLDMQVGIGSNSSLNKSGNLDGR